MTRRPAHACGPSEHAHAHACGLSRLPPTRVRDHAAPPRHRHGTHGHTRARGLAGDRPPAHTCARPDVHTHPCTPRCALARMHGPSRASSRMFTRTHMHPPGHACSYRCANAHCITCARSMCTAPDVYSHMCRLTHVYTRPHFQICMLTQVHKSCALTLHAHTRAQHQMCTPRCAHT